MNSIELPTIELIDPQGEGWCLDMPAASLPAGVAEIGVTDRGVYIELTDKRYSFIPWDELTELVEQDADADRVDLPAPYGLTEAGAAWLDEEIAAGRIRAAVGDAPLVLTGREQAFLEWIGETHGVYHAQRRRVPRGDRLVYAEAPERLIVSNGRVSA